MRKAISVVLMALMLAQPAMAGGFKMSDHIGWTEQDKLPHLFGTYVLAYELDYLLKKPWLAALLGFTIAELNEIKDGLVSYKDVGVTGGEGFGLADTGVNATGALYYIISHRPSRDSWRMPVILVASNLAYNLLTQDKLLPHGVKWQQRDFPKQGWLPDQNAQNSLIIPIWVMSTTRERYSLLERAGLAGAAVVSYEILNGFFDDRDLWGFGTHPKRRGFRTKDLLLGGTSILGMSLYELLVHPSNVTLTPNIELNGFTLTLRW